MNRSALLRALGTYCIASLLAGFVVAPSLHLNDQLRRGQFLLYLVYPPVAGYRIAAGTATGEHVGFLAVFGTVMVVAIAFVVRGRRASRRPK